MRKILATLMALVMALALMVPATWADGEDTYQIPDDLTGKTVVLHTNDVHGAVAKYAKVAALKADFEAKGADVILVDAGDFSQGTVYVSLSKGASAVELMNATGYDYATLGNHEFDYGYPQLAANLEKADFDMLCCNIFDAMGNYLFFPGAIVENEAADLTIGFVGVNTPESQTKANPALIKGLSWKFEDAMYEEVSEAADGLISQAGADVVIALTHLGVDSESEPNRSADLMAHVTGVDFCIDGHSHTVMTANEENSWIQSTGTALAYVGVIVIDNATKTIEDNGLFDLSAYEKEDATVKALADKLIADVDSEYDVVFAKTEVRLNGDRDPGNRTEETNLGNLITDSMLWAINTQAELTVPAENVVAITNGGGIRATIEAGDITKKDVNTVLPFGNTVAVVYVTGAELLEALEASTYCTPTAVGGFPQIAGMKITIDTTKEYDPCADTYPGSTYYGPATIQRVTIDEINGKPFDVRATYAVVTNNFTAAGGDTYYAFASASGQFDTGLPLDEVLMQYITEELNGVITAEQYGQTEGRITIVLPDETPDEKPESPKTADAGVLVYGLVALMSASGAVVVGKKRK